MPGLGRIVKFDERSKAFPIRSLLPTVTKRRRILWANGSILDQGNMPACVGFSWMTEALGSPVRVNLTETAYGTYGASSLAYQAYVHANSIDGIPGAHDGSTILAGAKVMQEMGFIGGYRWAFGITDLRDTLLGHGPAVLGIPWLADMFDPDPTGVIHATGDVAGGHAIWCNGYEPGLGFHLQNTWGPGWGRNGGAWIPDLDLAGLLADDGEVCVPVERSYNRSPRRGE